MLGGFPPQRLKLMHRRATEEAMMWDEAAKGVRFGVLCEMVATFAGEDDAELRAASYLKGWVDTGMLAGFQLQ